MKPLLEYPEVYSILLSYLCLHLHIFVHSNYLNSFHEVKYQCTPMHWYLTSYKNTALLPEVHNDCLTFSKMLHNEVWFLATQAEELQLENIESRVPTTVFYVSQLKYLQIKISILILNLVAKHVFHVNIYSFISYINFLYPMNLSTKHDLLIFILTQETTKSHSPNFTTDRTSDSYASEP